MFDTYKIAAAIWQCTQFPFGSGHTFMAFWATAPAVDDGSAYSLSAQGIKVCGCVVLLTHLPGL
jgi:hypothetical protein